MKQAFESSGPYRNKRPAKLTSRTRSARTERYKNLILLSCN